MPVAFSYSGASVFTKNSSKALMKELSRAVVSVFVTLPAASAQWGASAAPVATRLTVRNSRRVVMAGLPICGGGVTRWGGAVGGRGPEAVKAARALAPSRRAGFQGPGPHPPP